MRWVCALGLLSALLHLSTSLLLGAFNIQIFGDKKASNPTLMDIITKVRIVFIFSMQVQCHVVNNK